MRHPADWTFQFPIFDGIGYGEEQRNNAHQYDPVIHYMHRGNIPHSIENPIGNRSIGQSKIANWLFLCKKILTK